MKRDGIAVVLRKLVLRLLIGVIQLSVLVPADRHLVRHQRIERNDLALAVAYDLRIGVVPQQEVRHKRFPEHEGTHLRVRLIVEQAVERMVERHCLAAAVRVFVEVQRQSCHSLGEDADAGVNRSHLHGTAFCYRFSGGAATHVKGVTRADCAVGGLVSGFE